MVPVISSEAIPPYLLLCWILSSRPTADQIRIPLTAHRWCIKPWLLQSQIILATIAWRKKMAKRTKLHFAAISAINVRAPRSNPEMSKLKNALKMHYVWSRMRRSENPISWMYRCKQIISQCRLSVIYHPNTGISVAEKDGLRSCFIGLQK